MLLDGASLQGPDFSTFGGEMKKEDRSLREIAADLKARGMRCNCDLDTWEPERSSGHSWVCRIHKKACKIKGDHE